MAVIDTKYEDPGSRPPYHGARRFSCGLRIALLIVAACCVTERGVAQRKSDLLPETVTLRNGLTLSGMHGDGENFLPDGPDLRADMKIVDQSFRRYFFSFAQEAASFPDEVAIRAESVDVVQRRSGRTPIPTTIGLAQFGEFDANGQRTVTLNTQHGQMEIRQGITRITPRFVELSGLTHDWESGLALTSVPPEILDGLLWQSVDPSNELDVRSICRLYIDAGLYVRAGMVVDRLTEEQRNGQIQWEELAGLIRAGIARQIVSELQQRSEVGQHDLVLASLRKFPTRIHPDERIDVQRLRRDYNRKSVDQQLIRNALMSLEAAVADEAIHQRVRRLRAALIADLNFDTQERLQSFLNLADDGTLSPESRLALAGSGWLMGDTESITSLTETLGLFDARELLLEFLRLPDSEGDLLRQLLEEIRTTEGVSVSRIAAMIRHLPPWRPPVATPPRQPVIIDYELHKITGADRGSDTSRAQYRVALPSGYSESRQYPTLLVLNRERLSSVDELVWWQVAADRAGMIIIAPDFPDSSTGQYGASAETHRRMLSAIHDARARFRIDSNRLFVAGHGVGGEAAMDLAIAHPDHFAGVISVGGLPRNHFTVAADAAPSLAQYFVSGDKQYQWYERSTRYFTSILRKRRDVVVSVYKNRGFESYKEETENLFLWMKNQSRAEVPDEIDARVARTTDTRLYWLESETIPDHLRSLEDATDWSGGMRASMRLRANLTRGNAVQLLGGTGPFVLSLRPDLPLLDVNSPILIRRNGRTKRIDWDPSLSDMLLTLKHNGDRDRLCYMRVEIP